MERQKTVAYFFWRERTHKLDRYLHWCPLKTGGYRYCINAYLRWKVKKLLPISFGVKEFGEVDRHLQSLPRRLHQPVHVRLETCTQQHCINTVRRTVTHVGIRIRFNLELTDQVRSESQTGDRPSDIFLYNKTALRIRIQWIRIHKTTKRLLKDWPARSLLMVLRSRSWITTRYPYRVEITIFRTSGVSRIRIRPFV